MKVWKSTGILLSILFLVLTLAGCNSAGAESDRPINKATIGTGDLTTRVSGSGKVVVLNDAKLSFGSNGKIEIENVKEGDKVSKGQLLAKLDTSALELNLSAARVARSSAQLTLTSAQSAETLAEIALASAQFNLDQVKAVSDIEDDITSAQMDLAAARIQSEESRIYSDSKASAYWLNRIGQLEARLAQKQHDLATLLSKDEYYGQFLYLSGQQYDRLVVDAVRIRQLQFESAQQSVQQAAQSVELAKQALDQANKTIAVYQKYLDDASIIAPFDGTVAAIYFKQGDVVPSALAAPQIIMYMVDTQNLEVDVNVDETTVSSVRVGQSADISINVIQGVSLKGQVSSISIIPNAQAAAAGMTSYIGKITFSVPGGMEIKPGLNATVNIITSERRNVLLAPSDAVKQDKQGNTYVQVINDQGIKDQPVVTGMRDAAGTEIVNGLKEGDQVVTGVNWSIQEK